tara:strand:- start:89 stop:1885 length:1797 start_codon:yes stop_codon:yes gene_type:complete
MPDKKVKPVRYASKEFQSIKSSLVEYAKTYYPDTYKDFNDASFGSLMLDTVAYIGDMLSFYIDYQSNESFIDSAIETKNLLKLAKQFGYKRPMEFSSAGKCAFYAQVPATTTGIPDETLIPILKEGTTLSSAGGTSLRLVGDVDFSKSNSEVVVAEVDSDGTPTSFAYKAYGDVISGIIETEVLSVGSYQKFLKLSLKSENITEIVSVVDSEGNEHFEVPYLSHNIVYQAIRNPSLSGNTDAPYIMREKMVARRFITEVDENGTTSLQFGYGSESTLKNNQFPDPTNVALQRYARNYYSDDSFDPSILLKTDKFGIVPPSGDLIVTYRKNDSSAVNIPIGSVNSINSAILGFSTDDVPSDNIRRFIIDSLDVENEEAILGQVDEARQEEIRIRAINSFSSQNRAVTKQDYISLVYRMPPKFGALKRANIVQDRDSFKRNLNLYVVSEDIDGNLTESSSTIKENLKLWLSQYKMINDTIDILNGQVVNFGIEYKVLGTLDSSQTEILSDCNTALKDKYTEKLLFGEPFYISDIYRTLNDLDKVVDTQDVKIVQKLGTNYSSTDFDVEGATTDDERFIIIPEDIVMELKFPDEDIVGVVV